MYANDAQNTYTSSCAVSTTNTSSEVMTCGEDFTPYIFNDDSKFRFKILAGCLTAICVLAIFQNSMVLLVMCRERSIRKIRLNRFLMVLTFIDLMLAISAIPIFIYYDLLLSEGRFCCQVGRLLLTTVFSFIMMSVITITFITVQLYLAILHPFVYTGKYNQRIPLPFLITLNTLCVLVTALVVGVFREWWPIYRLINSSIAVVVYLVMCCLHVCISRETKRIERSGTNTSLTYRKGASKTLKLATSVLVSFGLCYLPYVGLSVYTTIESLTPHINTYIEPWAHVLGMTACVWSPLLYCVRLGSIRKRILRLFCCRTSSGTDETKTRERATTLPMKSVFISD